MKEENKIKSITATSVFCIGIGLWVWTMLTNCCTSINRQFNERFSTKEFKEAKFIDAKVVFIDSVFRDNPYRYITRIFWEDSDNIKWVTYSNSPCPFKVGVRILLLTKR